MKCIPIFSGVLTFLTSVCCKMLGAALILAVFISQNRLLGGGDCVAAPEGSSWSL